MEEYSDQKKEYTNFSLALQFVNNTQAAWLLEAHDCREVSNILYRI